MTKIKGETYNITIDTNTISLEPIVQNLPLISVNANEQEDFSIFDLGPAIVNHIVIQVANCTINDTIYQGSCLVIDQEAGNYIQIVFREPRTNRTHPIDSGNIIYTFKDYVVKYLD